MTVLAVPQIPGVRTVALLSARGEH